MSVWKCYVIITDPERRKLIEDIFPEGKIPLIHPFPVWNEEFETYMYAGNPSVLSKEQKEKLAMKIAEKFKLDRREILQDLEEGVLPIKAEGCILICEEIPAIIF